MESFQTFLSVVQKTPLSLDTREKIAQFCHVSTQAVLSAHDVSNIYRVPLLLEKQGMCSLLGIDCEGSEFLNQWESMAQQVDDCHETVTIAMVGKYTGLSDSYLSVIKGLQHAAHAENRQLVIEWIEASNLEDSTHDSWQALKRSDGILVPGVWYRGIEGNYWQQNTLGKQVPYLGICLGLQVATIEFCRNVLGLEEANSTEFDEKTPHPVVIFMPEISKTHLGGTMRLGSRVTNFLVNDSNIRNLYGGADQVYERHRHRYEVNPDYIERIETNGMKFVGKDESGQRCEILELERPSLFCCSSISSRVKSRPNRPSPPFLGLIKSSIR